MEFMTRFEKPGFHTHTQPQSYNFTRNRLLVQHTVIFHCVSLVVVTTYPRPWVCNRWVMLYYQWLVMVLLKWCSEGWVSHEYLPVSFIFSKKCCEHEQGLLRPQMGSLAFNTPFYAFTWSPPTPPITTRCYIITLPKAAQNSLNVGCFIPPQNYGSQILAVNFDFSICYTRKLYYNCYLKFRM